MKDEEKKKDNRIHSPVDGVNKNKKKIILKKPQWKEIMESILDAGYKCGDSMLRKAVERKLEIIDNLIILAGGRLRSRQIIAQVIADQHERLGGMERRNWDIRESGTEELAERLRV